METLIRAFLRDHQYTSQFVIDALRSQGSIDSMLSAGRLILEHANDGERITSLTYISSSPRVHIVGPFCSRHFEAISYVRQQERFIGVNGSGTAVRDFLSWSSEIGLKRPVHVFNETVFSLPLPSRENSKMETNFLTPADFEDWHTLYVKYLKEMQINSSATEADRRHRFLVEVSRKMHWGLRIQGHLVSIGAFNAMTSESAQVGGVFTSPEHRRRGYSEDVMKAIIRDASTAHDLKELILFTGVNDVGPQSLYRKLGFAPVADYSVAEF